MNLISMKNTTTIRQPDKTTIGLIGPFGYGNLGDAAIQQSMIQNIRIQCPEAQIYGFSLNPEDTFIRHGITSFPIGRMAKDGWLESETNGSRFQTFLKRYNTFRSRSSKLFRILDVVAIRPMIELMGLIHTSQHLTGMDYLIVSGGGQLDDYWGGAFQHPYTLLIWGLLARIKKVKYLFVSVGAGPLDAFFSKIFDRWALSLATYRSYRDLASKIYMEKVGFKHRDDPIYPDLAFSLEKTGYERRLFSDTDGQLVIGIGPMDYFDPRVWPERDQKVYDRYLCKLAAFTAWLIQRGEKVLLFTGEAV